MEGINKILCGQEAKNTGLCDCFFDPKLMVGAILVPKKKVFTQEELLDANIQATLEALVIEDKNLRTFPMQGFVAIADTTEEPVEQTFGYGTKEPVREGHYVWTFNFRNGGVTLSNALRSFNGQINKYAVIFIESQNTLLGTVKKDADGNNGLAGIPLEVLYAFPWKVNTGAENTAYRIKFDFLAQYINELIAFKTVTLTSYVLQELNGLEDIVLSAIDGEGTTEVTIKADTDCGSTDLYELFADELDNEEAWVGYDDDGGTIVASSVSKDASDHAWIVTFASIPASVSLASPKVLAQSPVGVIGYESDVLLLESGS